MPAKQRGSVVLVDALLVGAADRDMLCSLLLAKVPLSFGRHNCPVPLWAQTQGIDLSSWDVQRVGLKR